MSYILDALRRAQAERERGQVPGLHAQPGLGGGPRMRAAAGPAARPAWLWALGGAVLVALVLVPVMLLTRGSGSPQAAAPVGAAAAPQPAAAGGPAAGQPLVVVSASPGAAKGAGAPAAALALPAVPRAGTVPAAAPAPVSAAAHLAAPAPPAAPRLEAQPPLAGQAAPPAPGTATAGVPQTTAVPGAAAADTPPPSAAPAATAAAPPVPSAATSARSVAAPAPLTLPPMLTAEQKRDWPALSLGGSVWSETPSARFVILGGQVVREGDSTPEGVQVERITPKAVVLRWRDQRAALPL